MRTLVEIRAHYSKLYTQATELTLDRIHYGKIWRELRYHQRKPKAAKHIRAMRDTALERDKHYYQEALDLLTGKSQQ